MLFDSYAILLCSQASLKSYNYRSKNYQTKEQGTPIDCSGRSKLIQLNGLLQLIGIFIY